MAEQLSELGQRAVERLDEWLRDYDTVLHLISQSKDGWPKGAVDYAVAVRAGEPGALGPLLVHPGTAGVLSATGAVREFTSRLNQPLNGVPQRARA